jgi:hypothetical protein
MMIDHPLTQPLPLKGERRPILQTPLKEEWRTILQTSLKGK